ncbi:MAG: hypothetical protein IJY86_11930 [Clostridia bacterium]|nr:hypothetical protein [Clostridia bacterium]
MDLTILPQSFSKLIFGSKTSHEVPQKTATRINDAAVTYKSCPMIHLNLPTRTSENWELAS